MNTILTDDERPKLPMPRVIRGANPHVYSDLDMEAYADARESAVLAKLARQEPVAWLESDQSTASWPARDLFFGFSATAYSSRMHFGNKPKGTSNRLTPLYAHPAPQQADRQRVPSRAEIREVFLVNGFTVKDGQTDLKPYVYAAAHALLNLAAATEAPAQASAVDERAAFEAWHRSLPNNARKAGLTLLEAWLARASLAQKGGAA